MSKQKEYISHPAGHRIKIKIEEISQEKEIYSESGLVLRIKTNDELEREQNSYVRGWVLEIGPTAYKCIDDGTPWCKVGDYVAVSKHAGTQEFEEQTGALVRIVKDVDIQMVYTKVGDK